MPPVLYMESIEKLKEKLRSYNKDAIVFTNHSKIMALQRGLSLDEITGNILKPDKMFYARPQEAEKSGEEKYDCYFSMSNNLCHRYVLITDGKIIVCTVIKINRRWQRRAEHHEKV